MRTKKHAITLLASAWVLWAQQDFGLYTSDWQPVEGFSTYEQCTQAERGSFINNQKQFKKRKQNQKRFLSACPIASTRVLQKVRETIRPSEQTGDHRPF